MQLTVKQLVRGVGLAVASIGFVSVSIFGIVHSLLTGDPSGFVAVCGAWIIVGAAPAAIDWLNS